MIVGGFVLADVAGPERDQQVVDALLRGGVVDWGWVQVPLDEGRGYFVVSADYLTIGRENDWSRVPMGGPAGQAVADQFDAVLPTAYMVDLIWRIGGTKLDPQPFRDLTGMTSTKRFVEHNAIIEQQRKGRQGLVVGHKKDVILSNRLQQMPNAVCIYGWHQPNGQPIQPVSTKHNQWWYSDYSHGVRLVKRQMVLDGQTVDVEQVWRDPKVAHVLTGGQPYAARTKQDDAVLRITRYNTELLSKGGQTPARAPTVATPEHLSPDDLGYRALVWCRAEFDAGVAEVPPGSNAGPRIAEYFRPARRRATGQLLGIDQGDWCAVAQSAALGAVAQPNEAVPHGYRAAVWELEEDARESKAWVPAADIRSGKYVLRPGDLVLWTRGQPGSRLGHVSRVEVPADPKGVIGTLGANENNAWTRRPRSIHETEFRGAIKYRDFLRVDFSGKKGPTEYAALVAEQESILRSKPPETMPQVSLHSVSFEKVFTEEGWLLFEEDYLPRVVTGENGRAHPEALKAQAIASRTYVARAMQDDLALGRTKPIPNSQKFQVFAKTALPACVAAVQATHGIVAGYQGRLIIANYVAGAIWEGGKPGRDPTKTEKWVTYNEGRTGTNVIPTRLSSIKRSDNRGCMSQNGADWLARAGRNYIDILRFFYGADVQLSGPKEIPWSSQTPPKGATMTMMQSSIAQKPTPNLIRRPSGIEVLAMSSSGGRIAKPATTIVHTANPRAPLMPAIGADPLQEILSENDKVIGAMNEKVTTYFGDDESVRHQWEQYRQAWRMFYYRNWFDTPLREADAMQRAFAYKEGLNGWNNTVAARVAELNQGHTVYQGKVSGGIGGFPVLPALAVAAAVVTAAVFAGARA